MGTPEADARKNIDAALTSAGWLVQDYADPNLAAGLGVAVREFPLERGHGKADYALYVAGKLAGIVELEQFEAIQADLARSGVSETGSNKRR